MKVDVTTEEVKGEGGDSKSKAFYQAVIKYQETVMQLPPGKSVSAMGVLTGEQEQLWLSVAGGSGSSLYHVSDSFANQICDPQMYVTDILPIGSDWILLAGSSFDHYRVEMWPVAGGLPVQIARFARRIGGGNPDTGQAAYPTFGTADMQFYVGARLRIKGGSLVGSHALQEECLIPQFRPIDDFNLTSVLVGVGVNLAAALETADERYCRQLYI